MTTSSNGAKKSEGKKLAGMEVSNHCKIFTLIKFLVVISIHAAAV